jgi:predicted PurR-regulated permease PerM
MNKIFMNKSLVIAIVVIVVILVIVVVSLQFSNPKNNVARSNNLGTGTNPTSTNSNLGKEAASEISDLIKAWSQNNQGSYANFMSDASSMKKMRQIFGSLKTTITFYVYSTQLHYVVRTYTSNDASSYCIDDSSANVKQMPQMADKDFRAQTNCSGQAL